MNDKSFDEKLDEILAELDQYNRREALTPSEVVAVFPELRVAKQTIKQLIRQAVERSKPFPVGGSEFADGYMAGIKQYEANLMKFIEESV